MVIPALIAALFFGAPTLQKPSAKATKIDFSREIQPILKARCASCHGGTERQGGLSLDSKALAGKTIIAGKSGQSALLTRLLGKDGQAQMPLGFAPLSPQQISSVKTWIDQGAPWPDSNQKSDHWAYQSITRPLEPPVMLTGIDAFVQARLNRAGLDFSPVADKVTRLRRLSLDLIGLPPTPKEVDTFLLDTAPDAYEKLIDRLLASPHFGERMALPWLDAARYADSNGFQQDGDTYQYVWRDWVVNAINQNMRFNQFTIEQLAGDLLPNATLDQKIATGFNRCHLLNGEGGAIAEEQRNVILFDRVEVTATTWLGLTVACAQCHDHKYDPITQKDYYRFLAYFNNVPETGTPPFGGQYRIAEPAIVAPSPKDSAALAALDATIAVEKQRETDAATTTPAVRLAPWQVYGPFAAASFDAAFDAETALTGLKPTEHPEWTDGAIQTLPSGDNAAIYLTRTIHSDKKQSLRLSLGSDDGVKVWLNGALVLSKKVSRAALPDQELITLELISGENQLVVKIVNGGGISGFYFRISQNSRLQALTKERETLIASLPRVMVMSDAMPRKTHLLDRGNYEAPKEELSAGTPYYLPTPVSGNRLELAKWLVRDDNPLTARVQVNRYWQLFFGNGLVKTSENFGVQAEPPTHPELLDYLASDFASDWDVKRLIRQIVLSRTYQQSSKLTPQLIAKDPENKLLSRAARFRLPSLLLRDVALASSGLLNAEVGGKPVYPYQPAGIWDGLSITKERDFTYPQSKGRDLYRRSLYTFWRRTVGPGNMFDASARQSCKVRLTKTSTPMHALTMLNDPTWVEAGRVLAQNVLQTVGPSTDARLTETFRRVCARRPSASELSVLRRSFDRARLAYTRDLSAAMAYLAVGESPRDPRLNTAEHAALASVCLAIYNLDEALTRE
jgi:mono/diheme cytochrome c family protein